MNGYLTGRQGKKLLHLARQALLHRLGRSEPVEKPEDGELHRELAAFVTLKKKGKLRGCIGHLEAVCPLWEGVRDNAVNAGFHDLRFSPLEESELEHIHIDISVLSQPQPLSYEDGEDLVRKLRPGIDGVILSDGRRRATFLPQVWQQLSAPQDFLSHLCLKAGLAGSAWRDYHLEILTYQVQCFEEEGE